MVCAFAYWQMTFGWAWPTLVFPMWGVGFGAAEVHRVGKKGCRSVRFLETPYVQAYSSFLSGYWDPMMKAVCDENTVLSLHIGTGHDVVGSAPEASIDHWMVLACQISAITAQELLFGPTLRALSGNDHSPPA